MNTIDNTKNHLLLYVRNPLTEASPKKDITAAPVIVQHQPDMPMMPSVPEQRANIDEIVIFFLDIN